MFVKKVSKIINTKKEEYIVSFSPIKTSVNYEIFQSKELKILNIITIPVILLSYLGFIYLTYNPPHYIFIYLFT